MLSLSPSNRFAHEVASQTVNRAKLVPIVERQTPNNLSAIPPAIRALPPSLQIAALCDMLADARETIERLQVGIRMRDRDKNELHDTLANVRSELIKMREYRDIASRRFTEAAGVAFQYGAPINQIISR